LELSEISQDLDKAKPLSVLYIHHCGIFGGASKSLFEMICAFPKGTVNPFVITQRGSTAEYFRKNSIQVLETKGLSQFDNSQYSYYRGLRWLIFFLRELFYVPFTVFSIFKAKRLWPSIDIIHINDITNIPSVIFSKLIFNKPIIVHVRCVQRNCLKSYRNRIITNILLKYCQEIIAIDETVRSSLSSKLSVKVIHNGFTVDAAMINNNKNLHNNFHKDKKLIIGYVGNLFRLKGIYEFLEALRICKFKGINVKFLIVGYKPPKSKSFKRLILKKLKFLQDSDEDVLKLIEEFNLKNDINFMSFTHRTSQFYKQMDVICFPSHLNAVGRPVFEAAFFKVPSIVAIENPIEDTIIHAQTGLCVEPKNPVALADAIQYFYQHPDEITRMGELAYELALKNFDNNKNAKNLLEVYRNLKQ